MTDVPLRAILRNRIFLTAAAALLLFPAALALYVMPRFTDMVTAQAESESIHFAQYLTRQLSLREYLENNGTLPTSLSWIITDLQNELNIQKLCFFDHDGVLTYSSDGSSTAGRIGSEAVLRGLRQGLPHSRLVRSGGLTVDGSPAPTAVLETYVPVMSGERFLGAFEVYHEISPAVRELDALGRTILFGAVGLSGLLLLLALAGARREARIRLEQQRSASANRTLMEQASDGIFVFDAGGRIMETNAMACSLTGLSAPDCAALNPGDIFRLPDCPDIQACLTSLEKGRTLRMEGGIRRPDGAELPVAMSLKQLDDGRVVVTAQDISERMEAQRALRAQVAFLQTLLDALPLPVFYKDANGVYLGCNAAYLLFHGLTRDHVIGRTAQEILPARQAEASQQADALLRVQPDVSRTYEVRLPDGNGKERVILYSKAAFRDAAGGFAGFVGSIQDITERTRAQERLREARDRLESMVAERTGELVRANEELSLMARVFEHSLDGISITDAQGVIIKVNPAFCRITGYSVEEVVGQNPRVLKSDRHDSAFYAAMWSALSRDGQWEGEIWNRRKNGEAYPEWLSISSIRDADGRAAHYVAVFHDITEVKRSEELMKHKAYHDALTGLPNRLLLLDRLGVAITHAKRGSNRLALLFLDMDNFKTVNDSLGHSVGDLLLMAFAHRLKSLLREQDTVARLGGDEFVIMIEEVEDVNSAVAVGERILDAMRHSITVKGHELYVTASIGITFYPEDGATPEILIKNADLAMYRAKEQGKNNCQLFTMAMNERAHARLTLERSLRKAVEKTEFEVWYQPKVHLATYGIIGMEALVRWRREDGSLVPPAEFIPVAEETGIIGAIGDQVLETACRQAKLWHDSGWPHLALAVNLSMRQIGQKGLLEQIAAVLKRTDIDPSLLELEITETAIMSRVEQAVATLEEIRRLGVHIAVDDFGTGYSSLYYLKRFPIRGVKVDRSFVRNLPHDTDDLAIVRTIMAMSRGLGLHVTAEGVETMEQLESLRRMDCDFAQGYLFSPPVNAESFTRILVAGGGLLRPGGPSAVGGTGAQSS